MTFYAQADGFCGTVTDSVTVNYDTLVPSVSSTTPADSDTDVAKDSNVTINFSEDVDCATVDTASVTIAPAPTTSWSRRTIASSAGPFAGRSWSSP